MTPHAAMPAPLQMALGFDAAAHHSQRPHVVAALADAGPGPSGIGVNVGVAPPLPPRSVGASPNRGSSISGARQALFRNPDFNRNPSIGGDGDDELAALGAVGGAAALGNGALGVAALLPDNPSRDYDSECSDIASATGQPSHAAE